MKISKVRLVFKLILPFSFMLSSFVLLTSCGGGTSRKKASENFLRVKSIDGNTLTLSSGLNVELIGIENTVEVESYLKTTLNNRVKVTYDSKKVPRRESSKIKVFGYLKDELGKNINAELLKKKISKLNGRYLNDSLYNFKQYVIYQDKKPVLEKENTPSKKWSIDKIKAASFMVHSYDKHGNGIGQGSGFFISETGIGVSNHHVFENGEQWQIVSCDNDEIYRVSEIYDFSENFDYIIFQVEGNEDFDYFDIGKKTPSQGDEIIVYGNPRGLDCTLSKGVVSATRDYLGETNAKIQIDAAISPGSSGSPIVNDAGEVVAIATLKQLKCENCNFGMNINLIFNSISKESL